MRERTGHALAQGRSYSMVLTQIGFFSFGFLTALIPVLFILYYESSLFQSAQIIHGRVQPLADTSFKSWQELREWLVERRIDLSQWGVGEAKSLIDLWNEIRKGDTQLSDNPVCRRVNVAVVFIPSAETDQQSQSQYLIETEQVMADQRIRPRGWPPSEKIQEDEPLPDAAKRCIEEELGISNQAVKIIRQIPDARIELRHSPSYPGLITEYRLHVVEAQVQGLPQRAFETEEERKDDTDPVRTHRWSWGELPQDFQHLLT